MDSFVLPRIRPSFGTIHLFYLSSLSNNLFHFSLERWGCKQSVSSSSWFKSKPDRFLKNLNVIFVVKLLLKESCVLAKIWSYYCLLFLQGLCTVFKTMCVSFWHEKYRQVFLMISIESLVGFLTSILLR